MKSDQRDPIDLLLADRLHKLEPGEVPSWDSFTDRRAAGSRRARLTIAGLSAVAAAVVIGLLVVPVLRSVPLQIPVIELATILPVEHNEQIAESNVPDEFRKARVSRLKILTSEFVDQPPKDSLVVVTDQQPMEQVQTTTDKTPNPTPSPSPSAHYTAPSRYAPARRAKASWAVGLFANVGYSQPTGSAGKQVVMMDYQVGKYSGEMAFDARELKHDFPVSVGASVQIGLARNLNLETGLNYTYLRSSSKKEPEMSYRYTQTLHYIGIPVAVSYDFLSNRRLDLYVIGGAMVEYAVGAESLSEVYSSMGADLISSTRTAIDTRGLMVSFNAAIGFNVNLTPMVGLYVEPGVSTYLPNDSHPVNFRTQSAVQFNLRAGIKVKL